MKQKTIIATVDNDGNVKIEGHNFVGAECEKATRFIEEGLGMKVSTKRKPEYHHTAAQAAQQSVRR